LLALKESFPEHEWKEPKQHKQHKPSGYWNDIENQRKFFEEIAPALNIKKPEDWYSVNVDTVMKMGGSFVNSPTHYKGSLIRGILVVWHVMLTIIALKSVYPEHNWKDIREVKEGGYWNNVRNQRQFFDQLAQKLNIQSPEGWYSLTSTKVQKMGGWFIGSHHKGSLISGILQVNFQAYNPALSSAYPEHQWKQVEPAYKPDGYWKDIKNQRAFFDQLAAKLNLKSLDDWNDVRLSTVQKMGGWFVNNPRYGGSLQEGT
jgi:hypothetical protein